LPGIQPHLTLICKYVRAKNVNSDKEKFDTSILKCFNYNGSDVIRVIDVMNVKLDKWEEKKKRRKEGVCLL
jgi:hypothetical protein